MKKTSAFMIFTVCLLLMSCASALQIETETVYTSRGSRSEGRSHFLYINGKQIPDCFSWLLADEKLYRFMTKNHLFGDDGYLLYSDEDQAKGDEIFPASDYSISDEERNRGWAKVPGRCSLPEGWFLGKYSGGTAAVSADRIDVFLEEAQPSFIARRTSPPKINSEQIKKVKN